MKLTNLFKKLATAALALAVVGMLAGCANGSSSSDDSKGGNSGGNNGGNNTPKYDYAIMYDDIFLFGVESSSYSAVKKFLTTGNYTESDKTLTVTDDGFDELINSPVMKENPNKTYVAIVVYRKSCLMSLTQDDITAAEAVLTVGADYTITHDGRVIELTDSGLQNGAALFQSK